MTVDFETFTLTASLADLSREPAAREHADAVEFRMDLADDPTSALAAYGGDLPVLATNRTSAEGGEAPPDEGRINALVTAVHDPAVEAVDVELAAVQSGQGERVLNAAAEVGVATVVSAHDFDGTPDLGQMDETLTAAADRGTVGKLAVTAERPGDVLDVLEITHERTQAGDRVATMAMGAAGRHSRAVTPLYGSRIGYAPLTAEEATAPGQFDIATLAGLVDRLGGESNFSR